MSAPAYEEATRQAERHLALQQALQALGFLSTAKLTDGVYGEQTRDAIVAWQTARGRAPTGLLGEDDARALEQEAPRRPELVPAPAPSLLSQRDEVALTPQHGIFRVPARINDAITLSFVLVSGASDVQIPADVAMTLARTGTITDEDFIGSQTYRLSDGSQLKGDQFKLREVRLGDHVARNVVASMGQVKGDLLLGQSFLSRFGTWAIDNTRHVLILGGSYGDQRNLVGAQRSGD